MLNVLIGEYINCQLTDSWKTLGFHAGAAVIVFRFVLECLFDHICERASEREGKKKEREPDTTHGAH